MTAAMARVVASGDLGDVVVRAAAPSGVLDELADGVFERARRVDETIEA